MSLSPIAFIMELKQYSCILLGIPDKNINGWLSAGRTC